MLVRRLTSSLAPERAVLPSLTAQRGFFRRLVVFLRVTFDVMMKRVRSSQGILGLIGRIERNRVLKFGKYDPSLRKRMK